MKDNLKIISVNVNFRIPESGAYFATFNMETGKMIFSNNSTISQLFLDKDMRNFILFCRYNEFEFWG